MSFKKGKTWGAGLLLSIALLSSCKSLKNTNTLFLSEYDKFADTAKNIYVANNYMNNSNADYKIQPFDIISLRNLQNPRGLVMTTPEEGIQTATTFRVGKDGIVTLPVVGSIKIDGLTQSQAASKIQEEYGSKLLKNPIIELMIVNYHVTLLGETLKPGLYQLDRENIGLIEILAKSGGLSAAADPRRVKIIRGDLKNPEIIYVNLKNIQSLGNEKLILRNNDIIYISPRGLNNLTQGISSYSSLIQPMILALNAVLLIYTLGR